MPFEPIGADSEDTVLLQSVSSFQKVAQRMSAELREKFFQHLGALLVSGRACSINMRPGRQWAALFCQSFKNISERSFEDLSENTLRRLLGQTPQWWSTSYGQVDATAAWKHHVRLVKFLSEGKMVVFDFRDQTQWGTGQIYGGLAPEGVPGSGRCGLSTSLSHANDSAPKPTRLVHHRGAQLYSWHDEW